MKKVARRVQQVKRSIFDTDRVVVYHGDCLNVMASMPEASVDTIVTDPPYHLTPGRTSCFPERYGQYEGEKGATKGFMGRKWDGGGIAFNPETWHAALRVAKPGAHLLAFGGTRTFHRLACAIEDAGWEMRDCLMWVYGSGFPKSLDVSKAIDKAAGAERIQGELRRKGGGRSPQPMYRDSNTPDRNAYWSEPATPDAAHWQGCGTALKPAWEPIILARKPLDGTVAECVLRHGTGALNIDATRIGNEKRFLGAAKNTGESPASIAPVNVTDYEGHEVSGRWPANTVFQHDARCVRVGERKIASNERPNCAGKNYSGARIIPRGYLEYRTYNRADTSGLETVDLWACVPDCPVRMLDGQSGERTSGSRKTGVRKGMGYHGAYGDGGPAIAGNSGGASRFFYTPKASTTERILGCPPGYENRHPTVKPLDLCRWLCRLTKSPDGGVVLDPFSGSGSIAVAALLEGRRAVAIELEEESAAVTVARVQAALKYGDELQNLKQYKLKGRKKLKRRR